jgi:hypothetical protein
VHKQNQSRIKFDRSADIAGVLSDAWLLETGMAIALNGLELK